MVSARTDDWTVRLLRIGALIWAVAALIRWITPVNVAGRNLVPVGCGSPASPRTDELTRYICADDVSGATAQAVALVVAAAALLLMSEVVAPRVRHAVQARGAMVAAVVAAPLLSMSVAGLVSEVTGSGADGALIRCGTPLAQATSEISAIMCGQMADQARAELLGGVALAFVLVVGGAYVGASWGRGRTLPRAGEDRGTDTSTQGSKES